MSFYSCQSIDQSAERYIRVLEMAKQAGRRDAECTLLLCVASRVFPGHGDWAKDNLSPKLKPSNSPYGLEALRTIWLEEFGPKSVTWRGIASQITWKTDIPLERTQQSNWPEVLYHDNQSAGSPRWTWGNVTGHLRNALAHGGIEWVQDSSPQDKPKPEDAGSEARMKLNQQSKATKWLIRDIAFISTKKDKDGNPVSLTACRMPVANFEALCFTWLRAIRDSEFKAPMEELYSHLPAESVAA